MQKKNWKAWLYLLPAIACIVQDGTDMAMNKFNPKKHKKTE